MHQLTVTETLFNLENVTLNGDFPIRTPPKKLTLASEQLWTGLQSPPSIIDSILYCDPLKFNIGQKDF